MDRLIDRSNNKIMQQRQHRLYWWKLQSRTRMRSRLLKMNSTGLGRGLARGTQQVR